MNCQNINLFESSSSIEKTALQLKLRLEVAQIDFHLNNSPKSWLQDLRFWIWTLRLDNIKVKGPEAHCPDAAPLPSEHSSLVIQNQVLTFISVVVHSWLGNWTLLNNYRITIVVAFLILTLTELYLNSLKRYNDSGLVSVHNRSINRYVRTHLYR